MTHECISCEGFINPQLVLPIEDQGPVDFTMSAKQVEQDVSLNSMKSIPEIVASQTLVWFITEHTMYGTCKSKIKNTAYIY